MNSFRDEQPALNAAVIEDIPYRLLRLKQTNSTIDASSHEENKVLRDEIRALGEEVNIVRRTNAGDQILNAEINLASRPPAPPVANICQVPIPPPTGPTFSLIIPTVD